MILHGDDKYSFDVFGAGTATAGSSEQGKRGQVSEMPVLYHDVTSEISEFERDEHAPHLDIRPVFQRCEQRMNRERHQEIAASDR